MASPRVFSHSGVSESQNWAEVEFHFTASAAGTKHALIAKQAAADQKVYFMTGDGSIDMTAAQAQAIARHPDGRSLSTDESELATGLVTYFTNIPAAADGAFCHAFAIGGLNASDILSAEIISCSQGTSAKNDAHRLVNFSAAVKLSGVSLNGSNALLKDDGSTAIAAGTDTLVCCNGVVFGAIKSPDVLDTLASGDLVTLKLKVKA